MTEPKTVEEKVDHLLFRLQALEAHLVNNIIKLQEQFTPDPELHNLIIKLNEYTRHVMQMHKGTCRIYEKMNDLASNFRKECAPYGEIKFLNKRLHEIQELLKTMNTGLESVKKPAGPLSWIEGLNVEIQKIKQQKGEEKMDKKIKKIQKDTKNLVKEEASLLKADKKRDKAVEMGEKMMKEKKK